jgi:hypothetical protein
MPPPARSTRPATVEEGGGEGAVRLEEKEREPCTMVVREDSAGGREETA